MANATITVLEADGVTQTDVTVLDVGRQAAAASKSTAMSTEDKAVLDAIAASLATIDNPDIGAGTGGSNTARVLIDSSQLGALGQATMANSAPVTLASNQDWPVSTTGFMKKEDVASADGDAGIPAMAVRKATPANTSGTDGDYEMLQMSAGRLWTSAAVEASENHIGEVGGKSAVVAVTLSTDTSAYASGDLIADTQQIDGFFRKADGTGIINSINIIDEDAQGVALYIIFMSTSTSLGTENSAPNISDANLTAGFQGIVSVATTDYVTISGAKVATIRNIGLPVKAVSGTDDLYVAVLNSTGTPTYTASGLELRIGALLD